MAKKQIFVMSSAAIEAACGAALDAIAARTAAEIEETASASAAVEVQEIPPTTVFARKTRMKRRMKKM